MKDDKDHVIWLLKALTQAIQCSKMVDHEAADGVIG